MKPGGTGKEMMEQERGILAEQRRSIRKRGTRGLRRGMAGLLAALMLMSCAAATRYQTSFMDVFDTVSLVLGYDRTEEGFTEKAENAHRELLELHRLFDIYNDYPGLNNLKTVNDNAGIRPVQVDRRIIDLLLFGKEVNELTGGKVNIAYGAVLRLWHDRRTAGLHDPASAALPDAEELRHAAEHTDIEKLIIDEEASTVYLEDPEMRLDVGGIAKGYATELAGRRAEELGAKSFLLNIGGNLRATGRRGDGKKWICPVENPFYVDSHSGEQYAAVTELEGMSLVTSGDYERYYVVDGKRYHHIVDPETGMPGGLHRSVTILTQDSGLADALSTGLFLMTEEEGRRLLSELNAARTSEDRAVEAMWVEPDGRTLYTEGFHSFLKSDGSK